MQGSNLCALSLESGADKGLEVGVRAPFVLPMGGQDLADGREEAGAVAAAAAAGGAAVAAAAATVVGQI